MEVSTRATTSSMDLSTMFTAMIEKFKEVEESSRANNENMEAKLQENSRANNEKLLAEVKELASTLSLLASGSFQYAVGNDYLIGMSQSTISKMVTRVAKEMEVKLCPNLIKFDPEQSNECMETFMRKYKIPGVIGCIDGTHIGLQKPSDNEHMFFNRKGFHSLNSMVVNFLRICFLKLTYYDHEYKLLAINSKYGGAAHDSFVWKHSNERDLLEDLSNNKKPKNSWLLGDSGYPLEPWCITPYRNPAEGLMETHFNEVHSKARCIVERSIGIFKARWKVLSNDKRSRYCPQKIALLANACAALHNICIKFKVDQYTVISVTESTQIEVDVGAETNVTRIGSKK
ncbi:putative nuclease HARBI1 [Calliphora vicina]|uniref:putative nuclease HARBI1 n=1 Tax=Calliphora vicina TaxID=7373 RepID=UPI00325A6FB3